VQTTAETDIQAAEPGVYPRGQVRVSRFRSIYRGVTTVNVITDPVKLDGDVSFPHLGLGAQPPAVDHYVERGAVTGHPAGFPPFGKPVSRKDGKLLVAGVAADASLGRKTPGAPRLTGQDPVNAGSGLAQPDPALMRGWLTIYTRNLSR